MTNRLSWFLILIEFVGFFGLLLIASEASWYLKRSFYNEYAVILNVIFYASPFIAWLLKKETGKEVFMIGTIGLFIYIIFIDCMYVLQLFDHGEELGFLQWLYILPSALITYTNY